MRDLKSYRMTPSRIAELLQPFFTEGDTSQDGCHSEPAGSGGKKPAFLTADQLELISTHIDILLRWNARVNLTAIRDPEEIVTRHFGESFFAARHLFGGGTALQGRVDRDRETEAPAPATLADIGSGAGFPGIPIKLWAPHISLTLIESNHKKATFLGEVARALTLTNINIKTSRAESVRAASFNVVTLRAVERFEAILPVAVGLVAPGGRLALLIGNSQVDQAHAKLTRLSWSAALPIPNSSARVLLVGQEIPEAIRRVEPR
jgi:16S rRNA (guanine527-N7)-methyltransferase